jgi:small subunit ribosomal protein S8e
MQYHTKSLRKPTGGMKRRGHKKKKIELGRVYPLTKLGSEKKVKLQVKGGNNKIRLLKTDSANVYDPKSKKTNKSKILDVLSNPSHHQFAKMKVLNRGAIINTELGEAKITSRPGQVGVVDAVLIKPKK